MRLLGSPAPALWLAALLLCGACIEYIEEDPKPHGTTGSGGVDTRYHPEPNGVHMSEADACEQVKKAYEIQKKKLCGVVTAPGCPSFLRMYYQPPCMEYDQGTADACVAYYATITVCEELTPDCCVLLGYPETAPPGCT